MRPPDKDISELTKKGLIAIVPAAGLGKRFSSSGKKTFTNLFNVPLLAHTLKRLQGEDLITEIIPVVMKQDTETVYGMAKEYHLDKIRHVAEGGKERQDSIYNALKYIETGSLKGSNERLVLVHDGVRPYFPENTISELLDGLRGMDGVIPGTMAKETLKEVSDDGMVIRTLQRSSIRAVQTPQLFRYTVVMKAYDKAYEEGFYATDDAALVERSGGRIKIISGSPYNIKVTTPEDLEMIEFILKKVVRS